MADAAATSVAKSERRLDDDGMTRIPDPVAVVAIFLWSGQRAMEDTLMSSWYDDLAGNPRIYCAARKTSQTVRRQWIRTARGRLTPQCSVASGHGGESMRDAFLAGFGVLALCCGCTRATYPDEPHVTAGIFLDEGERDTLPQGMQLRVVYSDGMDLTRSEEGFRPHLYNDVAHYCTIGYGHLVERQPCNGGEPPQFRAGLTEPEGTKLLTTDMRRAQVAVMLATTTTLTDGQYAALCDFTFNVGPTNFRKSTLLAVVNDRQWDRVPAQLKRWTFAGGKPVDGLASRREHEIKLFFEGQPGSLGAPPQGEDVSPIDIRSGERR
jgi:GH24 family phage-related lysozyme (muramidase)